jgi:hypothetical protein
MPNPQNIEKHKWKKGQSGNPKGRPKKIPDLGTSLAMVLGETKDNRTALDAMLLRLRNEAMSGNIRAVELLLKYAFPNGVENNHTNELTFVWGKDEGNGTNEG